MRRTVLLPGRRPGLRVTWPVLGIAFLAVLTVVLAQAPAGAVFTSSTGNGGNYVQAGPSFCVAPGAQSFDVHDTWTDESSTTTNHQSDTALHVRSQSGARAYTWLLFDMVLPHDCAVTSATLKLYDYTQSSPSRTITVQQANASWSAASITWSNQPGAVTSPTATSGSPTSAGYQSWNVTTLVQAQFAGTNYGFRIADLGTNLGTTYDNVYYDKNNTTYPPTLTVTFG